MLFVLTHHFYFLLIDVFCNIFFQTRELFAFKICSSRCHLSSMIFLMAPGNFSIISVQKLLNFRPSCLCVCSITFESLQAYGLESARLFSPGRFSRQKYQSGLMCPPVRDLPDPGIEPVSLMFPALAGGLFRVVQPLSIFLPINN